MYVQRRADREEIGTGIYTEGLLNVVVEYTCMEGSCYRWHGSRQVKTNCMFVGSR
jgi:hypothetical protein